MYLTQDLLNRNELCCMEDNHSYMSNMYAIEFSESSSIKGHCTPDQFVTVCAFFSKFTIHWSQVRYVSSS